MQLHKWMTAALTATAVAALVWQSGIVKAADLGGNCCADLEERVAELEATTARKGNRKVSLTISGEVSKAILWADQGAGYLGVSENYNYGSRFRIKGEAKLDKDWSAGYLIEVGVGDGAALNDMTKLAVRHNAVYVGTPLGKVTLGQTSSSTDGIVEIDLSNSNIAALSPLGVGNAFDGARTGVAKWTSPNLMGFEIEAARANDKTWDAALRYAGEFGGIRFAAGAGYTDGTVTGHSIGIGFPGTKLAGSASVMHVLSGLFLTASAADIKFDDATDHLRAQSAKAGWQKNVFGLGATTLFVEATRADFLAGLIETNDKTKIYGLGIVQSVDSLGLDLFATVRQFDTDGAAKNNLFMIGTRISF